MTEVLLALFVALVLLACLGHGIWVFVAWVLRQIFRRGRQGAARPSTACPVCNQHLDTSTRDCLHCGWSARSPTSASLRISIRQLTKLHDQGQLDRASYRTVLQVLQREAQVEEGIPRSIFTAEAAGASAPITKPPPPRPTGKIAAPQPTPPATAPPLASPRRAPATPEEPSAAPTPAPRPSLASRAQVYAAKRRADAEQPEVKQPVPRRKLSELFAAFMEEKHIRWGELVGGLLIVSCSIALVISFWSKIADQPLLKFGVFNGVTAALFGLGLYAARRWKLPTTSQGLLMIAMLMVPLNFLAIAAFSEGSANARWIAFGGELVSLAGFASFTFFAARIVVPRWSPAITLGIMVPCGLDLAIRRFVDGASSLWMLYLGSSAALVTFAVTNGWVLADTLRQDRHVSDRRANELYKMLGVTMFAACMPLGLVLFKSQDWLANLQLLAPLAFLAAGPLLALGLVLWRQVEIRHWGHRTAGSSIAIGGAGILVAGMALSWPQPATLLPSGLIALLCLTAIALWFRIPEAHVPAACGALVAYLMSWFLGLGRIAWRIDDPGELISLLTSGLSGNLLIGLATLYALVTWWCQRGTRKADARYFGGFTIVAALLSLTLVSWNGLGQQGDPLGATWVYLFYAVVSFLGGWRSRQPTVSYVGGGLLLAAAVQGIIYGPARPFVPQQPAIMALLTHAAVLAGAAIIKVMILWTGTRPLHSTPASFAAWPASADQLSSLVVPCSVWAATTSTLALAAMLAQMLLGNGAPTAGYVLMVALVWLVLSLIWASPRWFSLFQLAISFALVCAVDDRLVQQLWYVGGNPGWIHPRSLCWQGVALGSLSLTWLAIRSVGRSFGVQADATTDTHTWRAVASRLLYPSWPRTDGLITAAVVMLLAALAVYAVVPGVGQELSPQTQFSQLRSPPDGPQTAPARNVPVASLFEIAGIPHQAAQSFVAWGLLGVLLVVLVAALYEQFRWHKLAGLALVASSACLLLSGRWEAQVAVASALRWHTAAFFALGSAIVWSRRPLARWLGIAACRPTGIKPVTVSRHSFCILIFLTVAPLVAMVMFVAIAAVLLRPPGQANLLLLQWLGGIFALAMLVWLGLPWLFVGTNGDTTRARPVAVSQTANVLLILAAAPLVAMTLFVIATALMQHPVVGPEPDSFFSRIGLSVSYALPLFVIACSLVGHAMHQRSAGLALTAGLVLQFCGTAAYLLSGVGSLGALEWLRLAQLNAIVAGAYAIGWMLFLYSQTRHLRRLTAAHPLVTQVAMAVGFLAFFLVPVSCALAWEPTVTFTWQRVAGFWGWPAAVLVVLSLGGLQWLQAPRRKISSESWLFLGFSACIVAIPLIALEANRWDEGNGLSFHTLMAACLLCGYAVLTLGVLMSQDRRRLGSGYALFLLAAGVLLSLRSIVGDPMGPWWSVRGLVASAGLAVVLSAWSQRRGYLFAAGGLLNVAVSTWWIQVGNRLTGSDGLATVLETCWVNLLVLSIPTILWRWIDKRWIAVRTVPHRVIAYHRAAAGLALGGLIVTVALSLASDAWGAPVQAHAGLGWLTLAAVLAGLAACLWDPDAGRSMLGLYVGGLSSVMLLVDQFDLDWRQLVWTGAMGLAAYSVGTSYLWSRRAGLATLGVRLGLPGQDSKPSRNTWLLPANALLATAVVILGYWVQLEFAELALRFAAAQGVIAQAFALGMLARGDKQSTLRVTALWVGVLGAVALGWSWLQPGTSGILLNRSVVLAIVFAGMAALYGLGLSKVIRRENDWTRAAEGLMTPLTALAIAMIALVLGAEVVLYLSQGAAEMVWWAILSVALTLMALAVACVLAAMLPGRDPFGLSERGRSAYVYAAEGILAALFLHVRLTMPWLFSGFFQQFWPLIVMLLAFLGVGLSEWFRRQRQAVLAEPLARSGALLPLLPVLGFWIGPTQVHFSLLMLSVGVLYSVLSAMRRSFGFGILAALAVNGGLWYLLYQSEGLGFLEHPQVWMIPPAVCVLVAAYLNRQNINESQLTAVRYASAAVIYTASTADVFLNGVAEAPWLPLVLAGLAIAGILLGICLRVRAFLFLGTAFLILALFTIIWYAAVDLHQTWIWYVTGIVTGALIIAVFAVFEKKREEILQLVQQLKHWEA